jgi:uncharacterized membrane protein YfcA
MARRNLSYLKNSFLFLVGLPCGVFTGLTGIGTSVLILPLLAYLLALRGAKAGGTALAVTFCAALTGMLSYGLHHDVRWGLAVVMTVGQVIGAIYGQRLGERFPSLSTPNLVWPILVILAGLAMSATAVGWPKPGVPGHDWALLPFLPTHGLLYWAAAFVLAFLVGLVSRVMAFGGVLLVPVEIYALHLTPQAAEGTALFVLLLASLPGMLIQARKGEIASQSATWISVGAIFGALTGAYYAAAVFSSLLLVLILGVVLIGLGLGMLWRRDKVAPDG